MRLINTETGLLEDFIGDDIPRCAILSHTWEKDEISLQEFQRLTDPDLEQDPKTIAGKAKAGYVKIQGCVNLARSREIPYVWVDTCCIDKTSSADLTESVNSMYRWYANSEVCFAYLVDVKTYEATDGRHAFPDWEKSRWFTRGWTLQELIAPTVVEFYCHSWYYFGTKQSLYDRLSNVTGIERKVLQTNDLSSISVAKKMSWASQRSTCRKEDMAYCLLGIFDINMPLLYGEAESAFLRLQQHIAASSTDHSIFAWGVPAGSAVGNQLRSYRSIFARSPADFAHCGTFVERVILQPDTWTQTNRGFHGVFPAIPAPVAKQLFHQSAAFLEYIDDEDYLVILNCRSSKPTSHSRWNCTGVWISVIEARDDGKHGFCRVTDTITFQSLAGIRQLLDSFPEKFCKDLWLATTPRMIRLQRDLFSKRLGGFLVRNSVYEDAKIYVNTNGLYGNQVNGDIKILPCEKLPVTLYGGLIGIVIVKVVVQEDGIDLEEVAAIIVGYASNSTKPLAKVVSYQGAEESAEKKKTPLESPLDFARRKFIEPDKEGYEDHAAWDFEHKSFGINVLLGTVLQKDMIFTELEIRLYKW
ncbi:HET-domain-containing protein [Hyaloscypha variabilis F]|uniref:HET-domain-containing protein n=1 Tax=Hyaloscypha variabilis (strain UAMH 11265 / GT02V1 / F) TaxID=1149755 RepID=A0A2J6RFC8_HYAVF|nr:HET-domain-containing protein [Hyaloscypha variabilis F]